MVPRPERDTRPERQTTPEPPPPASELEVLDVEVVLKGEYAGRNNEAYAQLQSHGLSILDKDEDDGVVEGTIPADRLAELQRLDCVAYVRTVLEYIAEKPAAGEGSGGTAAPA